MEVIADIYHRKLDYTLAGSKQSICPLPLEKNVTHNKTLTYNY